MDSEHSLPLSTTTERRLLDLWHVLNMNTEQSRPVTLNSSVHTTGLEPACVCLCLFMRGSKTVWLLLCVHACVCVFMGVHKHVCLKEFVLLFISLFSFFPLLCYINLYYWDEEYQSVFFYSFNSTKTIDKWNCNYFDNWSVKSFFKQNSSPPLIFSSPNVRICWKTALLLNSVSVFLTIKWIDVQGK